MRIAMMVGVILLVLFLCGAYSSAKAISNGGERIRNHLRNKTAERGPSASSGSEPAAIADACSTVHGCLGDLKRVFALYQSGILTKEEFEHVKRQLLAQIGSHG